MITNVMNKQFMYHRVRSTSQVSYILSSGYTHYMYIQAMQKLSAMGLGGTRDKIHHLYAFCGIDKYLYELAVGWLPPRFKIS